MKLNVQTLVEAVLTKDQMKLVALQYLQERFDIESGYYIKSGKVVCDYEECYGSHSSTCTEEIRDEVDSDKAVLEVYNRILKGEYYE